MENIFIKPQNNKIQNEYPLENKFPNLNKLIECKDQSYQDNLNLEIMTENFEVFNAIIIINFLNINKKYSLILKQINNNNNNINKIILNSLSFTIIDSLKYDNKQRCIGKLIIADKYIYYILESDFKKVNIVKELYLNETLELDNKKYQIYKIEIFTNKSYLRQLNILPHPNYNPPDIPFEHIFYPPP